MEKFIYAFDEEARDILIQKDYILVKSDDSKKIFIFENKPNASFTLDRFDFAFSDVLTF